MPAARVAYARSPPDAGGSVEVDKEAGCGAGWVLDQEEPIEQQGLRTRQPGGVGVQVTPTRLHHPDPRIGEGREQPLQQVARWHEVGIEDEHELAPRPRQAVGEGPRFVTGAASAPQVLDGDAARRVLRDARARQFHGFIVRVVQDLDLEPVAGIIEGADRINEPLYNAALVVDRQLHGDHRPRPGPAGRQRARAASAIQVHQPTAVQAERGQSQQRQRVGAENELGDHLRGRFASVTIASDASGSARRRSITRTIRSRHHALRRPDGRPPASRGPRLDCGPAARQLEAREAGLMATLDFNNDGAGGVPREQRRWRARSDHGLEES